MTAQIFSIHGGTVWLNEDKRMTLEDRHLEYLEELFDLGRTTPIGDDPQDRNTYNQWEKGFLADNSIRFEEYGATTIISPKQWSIMFRIGGHLGLDDPRWKN